MSSRRFRLSAAAVEADEGDVVMPSIATSAACCCAATAAAALAAAAACRDKENNSFMKS